MRGTGEGNTFERALPRLNFRPLLAAAIGAAEGVSLYLSIRRGDFSLADILLPLGALLLLFPPWEGRRVAAVLLLFAFFGGAGALSAHIYTERFLSGAEEAEYNIEGTVTLFAREEGYFYVELEGVTLNGIEVGGNLSLTTVEDVRTGDILKFSASLKRTEMTDSYAFPHDIRYEVGTVSPVRTGVSKDPFLAANAAFYNKLHGTMSEDEADIGYALLTGNARSLDGGITDMVRAGGIAHIFAVSGLHIGVLYGAALFLFKPLKKYAFLPALLVATAYAGLCGFSVSAVRALIMCAALGASAAVGRKSDLLSSLSLAAVLVLLFSPAQWLASGFRLSFTAVLGLALFSGTFSRAFARIRMPAFLSKYLSASLAVQLCTLPVCLEEFGYFSLWGMALNLVVVPLLPLLLGTLLSCLLVALILPFAAGVLILPEGLIALLLLLLRLDLSFVLTGFALGAGATVWAMGTVVLSERVRLRPALRGGAFALLAAALSLSLVYANVVPYGCRIECREELVFLETNDCRVLVVRDATLKECEDLLGRTDGAVLDAVVVLGENGRNTAIFLPADRVYAFAHGDGRIEEQTSFSVGSLRFRFEREDTLLLFAEGTVVAIEGGDMRAAGADLAIQISQNSLKYFVTEGIIYA